VNDAAWDILRQVGAVLSRGGANSPLGGLRAEHLYMGGYSQSGVEVATFASAFADQTRTAGGSPVYAGYLPLAHDASLTPLQSGTNSLPRFEFTAMGPVDVPVVDLETQTDVEGFKAAISATATYTNQGGFTIRRDDSDDPHDLFRLYEIPGAPHATGIPGCAGTPSTFPTDAFVRAATAQVIRWAEDGDPPPTADRIDLASHHGRVAVSAVDDVGNATGGVRSPFVDVPLVRYDVHSPGGALCELNGRQVPLPAAELSRRYDDADDYLAQFTDSLDATIHAGFLRQADRREIRHSAAEAAAAALP
jgi:hypothetical protein